jgi:hypothetical protein
VRRIALAYLLSTCRNFLSYLPKGAVAELFHYTWAPQNLATSNPDNNKLQYYYSLLVYYYERLWQDEKAMLERHLDLEALIEWVQAQVKAQNKSVLKTEMRRKERFFATLSRAELVEYLSHPPRPSSPSSSASPDRRLSLLAPLTEATVFSEMPWPLPAVEDDAADAAGAADAADWVELVMRGGMFDEMVEKSMGVETEKADDE